MRIFALVCLLFATLAAGAQDASLEATLLRLDKALVARDTVALKALLHPGVTYGHSNGWVQTRKEIIEDVASGKLQYTELLHSDERWTRNKDWACWRATSHVQYVLEGKEASVKLHVLQVWLRAGKRWLLLARQSTKL